MFRSVFKLVVGHLCRPRGAMSRQKGLRVMSVFELPAPRAGVVSSSWDFHRVRGAKHTAGTNGFHGAPRRTWGDAKGLLITAPCFGRKRSEVVRTMSCQKTPPANPGGTVPGRHELVAIESQLRGGVGQADPSVEIGAVRSNRQVRVVFDLPVLVECVDMAS